MTNVWVVRAEFGQYTQAFLEGSYAAIGWIRNKDLAAVDSREEIEQLYQQAYPEDEKRRVSANVYQIEAFLLKVKPGDYIITPRRETEWLEYGLVDEKPLYYFQDKDSCPFPHRREVRWAEKPLRRQEFSYPFQQTMKASKTVFSVRHAEEFLVKIGAKNPEVMTMKDPHTVVLERILTLSDKEFQDLCKALLEALGFEETKVTGQTGDRGVDVMGEFSTANLIKVKLFVQAKRWDVGYRVNASVITDLRGAIPMDGQGAVITTANFASNAYEEADRTGFQYISLINGDNLVDLLIEHWNTEPISEFHEQLGLKPGLVLQ